MTTHLTDTQKQTIRIALATYEGWTELQEIEDCLAGLPPNAKWLDDVPNYLASLDACHAIEVKLTEEDRKEFYRHLKIVVVRSNIEINNDHELHMACVSASAEHRSLALFRALNGD